MLPSLPTPNPSLRQRLQTLMLHYGQTALWVYLGIFVSVFVAIFASMQLGLDVEGAPANTGVVVAAYLATKLTLPARIMATLVVTPLVVRVLPKLRKRRDLAGE